MTNTQSLAQTPLQNAIVAGDLPAHFGVYAAPRRCQPRCTVFQVWLAAPADKPSGARVQCQLVEDSIGTSHQTRHCIQITSSKEHTITKQFDTGVLAVHSILWSPPPTLLRLNGATQESSVYLPLLDARLLLQACVPASGARCMPPAPTPQSS